jgi:hypothetical protein
MIMRSPISITIEQEIIDAVDAIVTIEKGRTLQGEDPVNRSRYIEHVLLDHLSTIDWKMGKPIDRK